MRGLPVCKTVCLNYEKIAALKEQIPPREVLEANADRHKVLGHPTRQAILHILAVEECCVCDLANVLDQPVSTVSQHLRMLRSAGFLRSRQEGKIVFYSLVLAEASKATLRGAPDTEEVLR